MDRGCNNLEIKKNTVMSEILNPNRSTKSKVETRHVCKMETNIESQF